MNRRTFFQKGLRFGGAALFTPLLHEACAGPLPPLEKSRITIARDTKVFSKPRQIDEQRLLQLLDKTVQAYFDRDNPAEAWKFLARKDEEIGLKVNCLSGFGSTHRQLVAALCERLQQAGIADRNIIIWDRLNRDLDEAGFKLNTTGNGIRCFGNDYAGFDDNLHTFGSAGSLVSTTLTKRCDAVINLPVLRDHSIAGVTLSLKNLFGAIHNPNKYHLHTGNPYIADVNSFDAIRRKVRFTFIDALEGQYEGGPSFMPQWRWPFSGLIAGEDRVAIDQTGWMIIEEKRKEMGLKPLKEVGREPVYIATAADANHRLGNNAVQKIEQQII